MPCESGFLSIFKSKLVVAIIHLKSGVIVPLAAV